MRRISFWLIACLLVLLLLAAVAQLILPGIAAQQIRDRLARSGRVLEVSVDAFPAIELLWHRADTVHIRMASYRSSTSSLSRNVAEVANAGRLDASAQLLTSGL